MHNAQQPTVVGYLYVHTSFRSALFGLCFQERILKPKQLWEFIRCPKTYKVVAENLVFFGGPSFLGKSILSKVPHWESSPGSLLQWLVLALPEVQGAPEVKKVVCGSSFNFITLSRPHRHPAWRPSLAGSPKLLFLMQAHGKRPLASKHTVHHRTLTVQTS